MPPFHFHQGTQPLLLSMPHVGTYIPPDIAETLLPTAREVHDTDWHLERLYDFAIGMGASVLAATHSRYVVDLNRPPDGASLYPGQNTTGLCPADAFDGSPLYRDGMAPDATQVAERRERYWQPYHSALQQELTRLRALHPRVVLWDAHSIRSVLPRFFDGRLPDLNFGTAKGASCDPELANRLMATADAATGFTAVLNGRFQGGYITRAYGQPALGVHAVQLEMTQASYMEEHPPFHYDESLALRVQPHLRTMLGEVLEFAPAA